MSAQHEHQRPDHAEWKIAGPADHDPEPPILELVGCPTCNQPAEIIRRAVLESTDRPIEHVKIRCILGHGFFMPVELLRALQSS
jgi:hypothetical protein